MKTKNKKNIENNWVDALSIYELGRWAALVEGVNLVADIAQEKNIPLKKVNFKIPAMKHYVDSKCNEITRQFDIQNMRVKEKENFVKEHEKNEIYSRV
jgi:hypothetical protein